MNFGKVQVVNAEFRDLVSACKCAAWPLECREILERKRQEVINLLGRAKAYSASKLADHVRSRDDQCGRPITNQRTVRYLQRRSHHRVSLRCAQTEIQFQG